MKILKLESSNIKRLKAVDLTLDEKQNLVVISGKNGQGKTSVLDSIWYALGGSKSIPDKPIREGTDKAEVSLDLGDYVVTRSFTAKGSYLKVENKEGAKYSNPQQLLDKLVGQLSFDPLEFTRLEAKKQIAELIKITGLDFTDLDSRTKTLGEERTFVSRELKAMGEIGQEEIEQAEKIAEQEEINITDLSNKIQEAVAAKTKWQNAEANIRMAKNEIEKLKAEIAKYEASIAEWEKITGPGVNIDEMQKDLANAESANTTIRRAKEILTRVKARNEKQTQHDKLTADLDAVASEKQTRLSNAKMPIEGLAWTEEAVTYHGIPFEQLSGAEQLKISMVMAMVANPKLRVILIRDGSLLDSDNLKVIQELATDLDFQVWIEKVDDSGKVGIYIEDGEVKEINGPTNNTADNSEVHGE